MVHIGFQHSRNCISQHRYFSRMACNLLPSCSFLYTVLSCQLLKDIIDIELMVRTLKGIHTYRRDCNIQTSSCSPWSSQVHPFPSLIKKMEAYMEERRNIENPFHPNHIHPNRLSAFPFTRFHISKKKKAKTPVKRSKIKNQKTNSRQRKERKLEGCCPPPGNNASLHIDIHASDQDHHYYYSTYPSSHVQPASTGGNHTTYQIL